MCCFSQPVKDVSKTQIFARMASPGRQLLAEQVAGLEDLRLQRLVDQVEAMARRNQLEG